ncbi:MAG: DUF3782 domain-containing protein [Candidatus Helarchaeota archaeon]
MTNIINEDQIRNLIKEEVEKQIKEIKQKDSLTKEEFLKAIDLMNKRFEAVDKRFEELIDTMNKRFEAVDKRFEELIDTMNKRFEATDKKFNKLVETMERGHLTLRAAIDSLGQRSGIRLEKTILKLLQKTLENRDIDINKIDWIELIDENGDVFSKNYRTDIDVLIKNGHIFLMEVKYKADNRDVFHFLKVAELYTKKFQRPNKLLLLTLDIDPRTLEYAERERIEVITGDPL